MTEVVQDMRCLVFDARRDPSAFYRCSKTLGHADAHEYDGKATCDFIDSLGKRAEAAEAARDRLMAAVDTFLAANRACEASESAHEFKEASDAISSAYDALAALSAKWSCPGNKPGVGP